MSGQRSVEARLGDILEWGGRVSIYISDMDRESFVADMKTQDAVIRCFESIGEAAGRILQSEPHLELDRPEVELRQAYQMRNRIAHGYEAIDLDVVWEAAVSSIPKIVDGARRLLLERS